MPEFSQAIFIVLLPLLSFVVIGFLGGIMKPIVSGIIGTTSLFVGMILSYFTAYQYFFGSGKGGGAFQKIISHNMEWLRFSDTLHIDMGILLDPISVMMLVVITTVSAMVHLYSIGYMEGESGFSRFYAYLSLFSFSMLGLVIATNIFQMYIFWELVGVSSFLLIGYYYDKPSAIAACKKAFIVTRFADLGFLLGILLISYITGTFDFIELTDPNGSAMAQGAGASFLGLSVMTWAVIMIYMGGAGKSAMFPLHVWLPDAMEGPTPVSALIHAATMVVAGVYLVARLFPLFALKATTGLEVVAFIGAFSSLFAAIIACTQVDIKRILAYSTMSQIGYMMLALGVSGYAGMNGLGFTASMFHLFTHAMFKALLFLGAGSIIHAVHSNNMTDMGGLRKYMPVTHITFLIACLAIAGIPPFAGFFSKDEILVAAYEDNKIYFAVEWLVAGLTAFYMFRLYFGVFWGKEQHYEHAPHESPKTMLFPLIFLAVGSMVTGWIPFSQFVSSDLQPYATHIHWNIAIPSILVAVVGIGVAMAFYKSESELPARFSSGLAGLHKAAYNKFYVDEVYLFVTKKVIFNLISKPIAWFDRNVIDAAMNVVAIVTNVIAGLIRGMQSGQLQHYAFVFIGGTVVLAITFLYIISA